jgi:hypothetical protein
MNGVFDPSAGRLILYAVIGIAVLLALIIKFKLQPLIAILFSAVLIGVGVGMPPQMVFWLNLSVFQFHTILKFSGQKYRKAQASVRRWDMVVTICSPLCPILCIKRGGFVRSEDFINDDEGKLRIAGFKYGLLTKKMPSVKVYYLYEKEIICSIRRRLPFLSPTPFRWFSSWIPVPV